MYALNWGPPSHGSMSLPIHLILNEAQTYLEEYVSDTPSNREFRRFLQISRGTMLEIVQDCENSYHVVEVERRGRSMALSTHHAKYDIASGRSHQRTQFHMRSLIYFQGRMEWVEKRIDVCSDRIEWRNSHVWAGILFSEIDIQMLKIGEDVVRSLANIPPFLQNSKKIYDKVISIYLIGSSRPYLLYIHEPSEIVQFVKHLKSHHRISGPLFMSAASQAHYHSIKQFAASRKCTIF